MIGVCSKQTRTWKSITAAGRKIIAVIDDDSLMIGALTRLPKAKGFYVHAFSTAGAFLNGDAVKKADCLVLDVGLAEISGTELALRLNAEGSQIPIIFITGLTSDELRANAMKTGCIAYLRKPFPASDLLSAIERATP